MSFANSAAALKGMIEAEDSKEKQPAAECSTCALIRCDHVLVRQNIIMMVLVGNSLPLPTIKQLYQHLNRIQLILIFSCAGLVIIWSLPPNALNAAPTYNSNTCDL